MDALFTSSFSFFSTTPTQPEESVKQLHQESEIVQNAEKEIERAFVLMELEKLEQAMKIFSDLHQHALSFKDDNPSDAKKIDDKIFEAGLEFLLDNQEQIAKKIFGAIVHFPGPGVSFIPHHREAVVAENFRIKKTISFWRNQELLSEAAEDGERCLKVTPHFLGMIYEQGLCLGGKNLTEADKFYQLAKERGYKVREKVMPKVCEEYGLMLQGQQSSASVFSSEYFPKELVMQIALARISELVNDKS